MCNFSASPSSWQYGVTDYWSESLVRDVLSMAYLIYAMYTLLSFSCFSPPWCIFFFFFWWNIPEWIQCNIRIKQWLSFTKHEVGSTDPGFFLPGHTLYQECVVTGHEIFKGKFSKVLCYQWKYDLVQKDRFGNSGETWKSLLSAEVGWVCTGFSYFVLVQLLAVARPLASKGSRHPSEPHALVETA